MPTDSFKIVSKVPIEMGTDDYLKIDKKEQLLSLELGEVRGRDAQLLDKKRREAQMWRPVFKETDA